ncbi:MAG: ATP-grasp domain-containing protein [Anaerococcus vaginalis]|uniref:ATP-grasp domain-containing protein n=1 Tax=Anaerococcus TaxID=165779 RepID=UPI0008A2FE3E|nr:MULTISPECIES: ATP-grasp domain-containing protein [Anaerococcus]MDU5086292.1 ATP-grasp domain-containing protein [Anaerococcus vaginalis]OFL16135.1 phosphoribosylglycinamide synthetase [Anaerococcus sp. HMSC068A02]
MYKNKKLLILGAGRGQLGLYKAAKELGIYTIAGTMPKAHKPCLELADEICHMDISNPDEVEQKAKDLKLDGAATCCLDTGIVSLARLCDKQNLVGLNEESAIMCGDKYKMKEAFKKNNVNTARHFVIKNEKELKNALEALELPVIVKATDLQGSKGIYIAKNEEEAINGFNQTMSLTKRDYCIVEEFIEGYEFGAQAFVYNNEVLFVMPHGDETYMSHTAVPIGHYVPLDVKDDIIEKTKIEVKKAIKALRLNNCAVNVDMILKNDEVYIIELTGRVGANCLPELVEINYDIEYYKMIASMAISENPLEFWSKKSKENKAGLARMIIETKESGILKEIVNSNEKDDDIVEITFFKEENDEIRKFENSNDCIGQVIVKADNIKRCEEKLKEIESNIKLILK